MYDYMVDPASVNQTRTRNGVNEYLAIDPDGPGGPLDAATLVYDDNGNLTLDPLAPRPGDDPNAPSGQVYAYDEENRLTAVSDASEPNQPLLLEIVYDALGRRVTSIDHLAGTTGDPCDGADPPVTIQHIYSGAAAIAEYQTCDGGARTLVREFLWGERFPELLAMITHGGQSGAIGGPAVPAGETAYHYLHDALGTVVALTDPNGIEVERYACDAYGKTIIEQIDAQTGEPLSRSAASAFGNPFNWTGQRYDGGVGLYHFLFRSYSPRLGRWSQRDPAGYVDGVSLYEYSRSDSLTRIDTLGLCSDDNQRHIADTAKYLQQLYAANEAEIAKNNERHNTLRSHIAAINTDLNHLVAGPPWADLIFSGTGLAIGAVGLATGGWGIAIVGIMVGVAGTIRPIDWLYVDSTLKYDLSSTSKRAAVISHLYLDALALANELKIVDARFEALLRLRWSIRFALEEIAAAHRQCNLRRNEWRREHPTEPYPDDPAFDRWARYAWFAATEVSYSGGPDPRDILSHLPTRSPGHWAGRCDHTGSGPVGPL